jgi:tetratricopeptide (TPR) repeat protein
MDAQLTQTSVECTDPSGLLPDVQAILSRRLPLKNLHWKSPTRPVRSIESLHIDLVPAEHVPDEQTVPKDATPAGPVAHRRHQIPGLRQTPYLKIYLLRCDDNETYKASSRKLLREWIKTHAATQQAGGAPGTQDNHDAFEWLILHVLQDGDSSEKTASTSKWPGRGPTSVLEKIKADFNGSSKPAVDRVAQLRLPKAGKAHDPSELIDQLNDLVDKIKYAILASFDLRVGQYEEDIREKDSQRNLPGWNFCTFFILKEGLARGFENMGLLEDALAGYDELALGLETAIGEYLSGTSDQHGGVFLSHSEDRKQKAEQALEAIIKRSKADDDGDSSDDNDGIGITLGLDEEHFPLDSTKKPYRDMILANNISIFDFRTYVFSRQLTLLLRAAGAPFLRDKESASNQKSGQKAKVENLTLLAEVCERATELIGVAARTLRSDLERALADTAVEADDATKKVVIDNIVSAWTYAACSQILSQTATPALILPESSLRQAKNSSDASEVAAEAAEPRPNVPRRLSSLQSSAAAPGRSMKHGAPSDVQSTAVPAPKSGSEDLASGRGEICQLARGALEGIGKRPGWLGKWENLDLLFDDSTALSGDLEEVSLDNDDVQTTEKPSLDSSPAYRLAGIELPVLRHALSSRKKFNRLYEELTDQMFRHYVAASRRRSAQAAMSEIAVLRFRQEDYSTAASFFHQLVPFYADSHWLMLEGTILELYARCLKELKQNEEYVRIVLRLLSRYASYTQSTLTKRQKMTVALTSPSVRSAVHPYIEDLLQASTGLQKECAVPLTDFFGDIEVDPEIRHYEDKDGFQLLLRLRFFLDKDIKIGSLKIRLVNGTGPLSNEVWLEHLEDVLIKSSSTKLLIGSSVSDKDTIVRDCNIWLIVGVDNVAGEVFRGQN